MAESLIKQLNNWIKNANGEMVTIDALEKQVKVWGYKISNYERRLRPSNSPNVEAIKKDGYIVGYKWKENNLPSMDSLTCSVCRMALEEGDPLVSGPRLRCSCGYWVVSKTTAKEWVFEDAQTLRPTLRFAIHKINP